MNLVDRLCRAYLRGRGYVVPPRGAQDIDGDYVLVTYGSYEEYVRIQTAGNRAKINSVWADEKTIDLICDYLRASGQPLRRGLCHGSRNGAEVRWFQERLNIDVIGTDISDTAANFGLVQWDFHNARPDWTGQFDFIYTNSHDHAYDPRLAFSTWVDQLSPTGKLIVEHTRLHTAEGVTELDPFGVDTRIFPYVILKFSEGRFSVTGMLQPDHEKKQSKVVVFIIERTAAAQRDRPLLEAEFGKGED